MTDKHKAETPQERADREARGEVDGVQLVNGSGEVKTVTEDEWSEQEAMLRDEGWKPMGED